MTQAHTPGSWRVGDAGRTVFGPPKQPNGEYLAQWRCPACGHLQSESVSPVYGPFISCICGECMRTFHDDELDAASVESLEAARVAAEQDAQS